MLNLNSVKRVIVGSTNPVKVQAVKDALACYLDHDIDVVGQKPKTGISEMPLHEQEVLQGAVNRAQACMQLGDYDMAFGLEGGVDFVQHTIVGLPAETVYLFGCVVAVDRNGAIHTAIGGKMELPHAIIQQLKSGRELGDIMDAMKGESNTKQKGGTYGFLTQGKISRTEGFKTVVIQALAPRLHPDLYVPTPHA